MIRTVVLGAAGRMGRTLVAEIQEDPELELAGALEAPQSPFIGVNASPVEPMTSETPFAAAIGA